MDWNRIQIWVSAAMTLAVLSYLWKENPLYRLAEYTVVPLTVANAVVLTWHQMIVPYTKYYIQQQGWWWLWIFAAVGLLFYFRYLPSKWAWVSRYPIAISVGWQLGYSFAQTPRPYATLLIDTMRPLNTVNNTLFFLMFIVTMMYFFFTIGRKSALVGGAGKIGRYVMMIAFGASFGQTIQGRISLFLARLSFLLKDWLMIKI